MGERRDRNHEPDEALLPKPPALMQDRRKECT